MLDKWKGLLKVPSKPTIWAFAILGLSTLSLALYGIGVRYVFYLQLAFMMSFTGSLVALLILLFRRIRLVLVRVLSVLLIAGVLFFCGTAIFCYTLFGIKPSDCRVETSPSGRNRLIVIDGGFIDSRYYAYPMMNPWMYLERDNGFIAYRDFWGDADDPTVKWVSDTEALVTLNVDFSLKEGSSGEIVVSFDYHNGRKMR